MILDSRACQTDNHTLLQALLSITPCSFDLRKKDFSHLLLDVFFLIGANALPAIPVCTICMPGAQEGQERALELTDGVSHHVHHVLGTKPGSSKE